MGGGSFITVVTGLLGVVIGGLPLRSVTLEMFIISAMSVHRYVEFHRDRCAHGKVG